MPDLYWTMDIDTAMAELNNILVTSIQCPAHVRSSYHIICDPAF